MPEEMGMTKDELRHELMLARQEIHRLRDENRRIGARNSEYFDKLQRYRQTVTRLEELVQDLGGDPWSRTPRRIERVRADLFSSAYMKARKANVDRLADQYAVAGIVWRRLVM